ncbi:uncharacterized protein METZ01_LOCUS360248, partial [marine metagenome]
HNLDQKEDFMQILPEGIYGLTLAWVFFRMI